ncbi:MAG: hypothetical protein QGG05_06510 [Candidatus Latescibacteria bacterium]|nr:hypothetical protein [Candidatus Latescibacterota bacterium]
MGRGSVYDEIGVRRVINASGSMTYLGGSLIAPEVLVKAPLMASYRSEIWMMGGARQDRTQIYDPRSKTWRNGPRLPTQQSWGGAAVLEGRLYITGGAHRSERHDLTIYDDRTWVLR